MELIKSELTREEAGIKLAELIKKYCLGNSMDQSIGFDFDGDPDYAYNVYGRGSIAVEVFNSAGGCEAYFGDVDYTDAAEWDTELLEYVADMSTGEWIENDSEYAIEFSAAK